MVGKYYNFGGNLLTSGQIAKQITLPGLVGGISAELMGGKFGHGFFSAGFTKGVMGAAGLSIKGSGTSIFDQFDDIRSNQIKRLWAPALVVLC